MLSDYEATQVMFFISCHDQDSPVVKHLYELHKLRDAQIHYRMISDSIINCAAQDEERLNEMLTYKETREVLDA